jgi:hypothetical protein
VSAIESDDNTELLVRIKTDGNYYAYKCGEFNVKSNKDRDFNLTIYAKRVLSIEIEE